KKIKKSTADVVFLHSSAYVLPAWIGNLISKKRKKIIVRETQANHLKSKMEWIWLAVALVIADKVVFLSMEYRDEIKKILSFFYRQKRVCVIPNGIHLDQYRGTNNGKAGTIIFGMQSRIVHLKDHQTLLHAFSLLLADNELQGEKILLKIAGEGEYKNELIKITADLQMEHSVEFTGMLAEPELIAFLHSLDIYIHASLGETMSTAIMQAMACSLPVIASDVRGINNMIQDGSNGMLVPVRNPAAMYRAMKTLINDPGTRISIAEQARFSAEKNFSYSRMMESYKNLFLEQ
ncbi:MAG TPA: glycosyltransferase family 4 protein, partial [Ferruginibacter sp.]|nr:glycosyltransferase family 4 protein [Ferruginibacter sp.]